MTAKRLLLLLVLPVLALALTPTGAAADDEFELDERLMDAGFSEAYSNYLYTEDGVRTQIDFESDSSDQAGYEAEARELAELTWKHLELRVLAVDITPGYELDWAGGLPAAVSYTRADLEQEFGPRSARLDAPGAGDFYGDEFGDMGFELAFLALTVLPLVVALLLGAGAGAAIGATVGHARGRRAASGWTPGWSPSAPGTWGAQAWSPPAVAPPPPAPGATSAGFQPPDPHDPWRTP